MTRIILHAVLPFLLPTLVFVLWVVFSHRRGNHDKSVVERVSGGPWMWLLAAGFVLLLAGLGFLAMEGDEPGGTYQPPRLEDGRIVPGRVVR